MPNNILAGEKLFAAIVEATYGVNANPTAAVNAMRVKANFTTKVDSEDMDFDNGMLGAKGALEKSRVAEGSIDGYLAGSGTANVAAAITPLLRAAGFNVVAGADKVDITLADLSDAASITGKFWMGTVSQVLSGMRVDCEIELSVDALPKLKFPNAKALYTARTNGAKPTGIDLSAFKNPIPTDPFNFVTQEVFGYSASISKVTLKLNNEVVYLPENGSIEIVGRRVTMSIELKEPTPDVIDFYELIGNYGAIDLQHGQDVADEGYIHEIHAANCQLKNVSQSERNKISYLTLEVDCIPTAPNNEISLIAR